MTTSGIDSSPSFVAVDIGNARIKLGLFGGGRSSGLPEPVRTLPLLGDAPELDQITPWLADVAHKNLIWWIASVNRPAATRLLDWLHTHRPADRVTLLAAGDLPLEVRLPRPDMVGVDRLVDAVAVNRLREPDRSAVIVDVGSAITVDLVSADGAFRGGAILPGIAMSARAMHEFTDLLPLVDVTEFVDAPPSALGTDTESAMQSGLFWGTVGAIRELIEQLQRAASQSCGGSSPQSWSGSPSQSWGGSSTATPSDAATPSDVVVQPQVFLTGGAGPTVAQLLGPNACHIPNLTLAGIAAAIK